MFVALPLPFSRDTTEASVPSRIVPQLPQSRSLEWQYWVQTFSFLKQIHRLVLHCLRQLHEIATLSDVEAAAAAACNVMTVRGAEISFSRRLSEASVGTRFNSLVG